MIWHGVIKALLIPPLPPLLLMLMAWMLWRQRYRWAVFSLAVAVCWLYAWSLPVVAGQLARWAEAAVAMTPEQLAQHRDRQVIIVLGGGRQAESPELGGADSPSVTTMERLRFAARVYRSTGLPLLVSGGAVYGEATAEAELMRDSLRQDFVMEPRWLEMQSRDTRENARRSAALLLPKGLHRIILVTSAVHMSRAEGEFRAAGFDVLPAPTGFYTDASTLPQVLRWLPRASAWSYSCMVENEAIARLVYSLTSLI